MLVRKTIKPKKIYIRDGRAPIPKSVATSHVMSAIKGKNTSPERKLRMALLRSRLKGFKIHIKSIPGMPDIVYPQTKTAIFVNGCFWHRCPKCKLKAPKTHTLYWKNKFTKNVFRDKRNIKLLKKIGWKTIIVWECELKKDIDRIVTKIAKIIAK